MKTVLHERKWWLIQRYELRSGVNTTANGVGRYLSGDYMGSAEFEWGAIPKAWAQIRGRENKIVVLELKTINGGDVTVLCPIHTDVGQLNAEFADLAADKFQHKEWTNFDRWFRQPRQFDRELETVAWLSVGDNVIPIFWTVDPFIVARVMPELMKSEATPADSTTEKPVEVTVNPDDLRMFDNVEFSHHNKLWRGQIRGIYEDHVVLAMPAGGTQSVKYIALNKIL